MVRSSQRKFLARVENCLDRCKVDSPTRKAPKMDYDPLFRFFTQIRASLDSMPMYHRIDLIFVFLLSERACKIIIQAI